MLATLTPEGRETMLYDLIKKYLSQMDGPEIHEAYGWVSENAHSMMPLVMREFGEKGFLTDLLFAWAKSYSEGKPDNDLLQNTKGMLVLLHAIEKFEQAKGLFAILSLGKEIDEFETLLREKYHDRPYYDNMVLSLRELGVCFEVGCYSAAVGICGKLLEISLKEVCERHSVSYDNNDMVGKLLSRIENAQIASEYFNSSAKNIANLINANRIPAVHAKEGYAVPTKDDTDAIIRFCFSLCKKAFNK